MQWNYGQIGQRSVSNPIPKSSNSTNEPTTGHLRRPHPQRPQRTHRLYEVIPPSAAPAILDLTAGTAAARAQRHVDGGTEVSYLGKINI